MKSLRNLLGIASLMGMTLFSTELARGADDNSKAEMEVRAVEDDLVDAMLKSDVNRLEKLFAPDFVYGDPSGGFLTRAQVISYLKDAKFLENSISDVKVRVYGTTAVVTSIGKMKYKIDGKDITLQSSATDVLVRMDGKWRVVSSHSAEVAPAGK